MNISGNLTVTGNSTRLQTTTVGGALTATATTTLDQRSGDALAVTGVSTLNGNTITLANAGNNFIGAVVVNNPASNVTLRDDTGGIQLGSSGSAFAANALNVETNSGNITQGNTLAITGQATLDAGTSNIVLNNTGNDFAGNVVISAAQDAHISDANALTLASANSRDLTLSTGGAITLGSNTSTNITVGRNLVITAAGSITETTGATLAITGDTTLTAYAGTTGYDITLNTANNNFNNVNILNAGNVNLRDSTGFIGIMGNVNGVLNVTANGSSASDVITNPGELNVTGLATFTTQAGQSINLSHAANTFNSDVNIVSTLRNLNLADSGALTLQNNLSLQGNLTVNASQITFNNTDVTGNLLATTTSGVMGQNNSTAILVDGSSHFVSGTGGIALTQANDFVGNVRVTTTGDANITDSNAITLGASDVGANLAVTANSINQVNSVLVDQDGIVVANAATFTVADGSSITLKNAENRFNSLNFLAATAGEALANVSISNASSIDLQSLRLTGDLTVAVASGNVTNSGALDVSTGTVRIAANNITLNHAANDFNNVALTGNTISVTDANSLNFVEQTTATNNLTVVTASGGDITDADNASITVTNTASFTGNNVTLDAGLHDFNTLQINTAAHAMVSDINGINIGTSVIAGDLTVIADSDNNGTHAITNTAGSIRVDGASSFVTSNNGDVILNNAANNFTGAISIDAASGSVRDGVITNAGATLLQTIDAARDLTITSGGAITDTTNALITVDNTTILSANGNDIVLDAANDFNVIDNITANAITLNDSNGLALGSVNANTINISVGGSLTDNNGTATNLTATNVILRAEDGIGSITDAIETRTANLDVINTQGGYLNIQNTGTVTLTNLVNVGDIEYLNTQGHVTLDHVETDYNTGFLDMRVNNGSIYGILPRTNAAGGEVNFLSVNDIKASSAILITTQELGTFTRPIVMDINNRLTYIAVGGFRPVVYGNPTIVNSSDLQGNAIGSVGAISGQQLIELESLADVDPAIFTAVRTYNYDDISIRMPSDQLFEDEDEEDESQQ